MNFNYYIAILVLFIKEISSNKTENALHDLWKESLWGERPQSMNDLTSILYYRFSDSSNGMSLKQFEHLLNCSRGLSDCPTHPPSEVNPFSLLTDCALNSDITSNQCDILHKCLNTVDFLQLLPSYNEDSPVVTEDQLRSIIPALLYQTQSQVCKETGSSETVLSNKPTIIEVWLYAFLFVTLISGCSLVGVSVLPLMARDFYQKLLTVLIGLAVGSLAGSSVFHLIPQAFGINSESGNHDYLYISLAILIGIWAFFMIERILKSIIVHQNHYPNKNMRGSASSQSIIKTASENGSKAAFTPSYRNIGDDSSLTDSPNRKGHVVNDINCGSSTANNVQLIFESQEQAIKASFGHEQKPEKSNEMQEIQFRQGKDSVIATVAWMIIFGDGFHNFIDGISIGAAFQQSIFTGISISVAVMCEELPHELGDFAVLLNSGMTMKQALFYNFLSATTCYAGMVVGILLGEFTENSTYIFALAGGMFLYISLVDMLPEMNEIATKAAEKSVKEIITVLLYQNLGLFLGVFSLFFLAYYQDQISFA